MPQPRPRVKLQLFLLLALLSVFSVPLWFKAAQPAVAHRSPVAVAVLPDGQRALTANQTSASVSLVDLRAGKVLAEVPCGRRPVAVVCSPDGKHAVVSNHWSQTLSLYDIGATSLTPAS